MPPGSYDGEAVQPPKSGLLLLQVMILGLFCVFALRFWYLQVHRGADYERLARENQLRQEPVYAPRGLLRDRQGRLLAVNEPAYALGLVREDAPDVTETLDQLAAWTGADREELRQRFHKNKRRVKPFEPMIMAPDIDFDTLARVEANALYWPGLEVVVRPRRHYPHGPLMAHILGYVAEADEEEMEADERLALGDTVGKQGLELVLEERLRGQKGLRQLEVDATGRDLDLKLIRAPRAGRNLALSIDLDLQRHAFDLLAGQAGCAVVLEPDTGQVLALVTQPSYDNNAFAAGLSNAQWAALRDDPRHPLQNRVIQSVYPPGSVWKLLVGGCALESGLVDPAETVYCSGKYRLGRRVFRCWKKHGHGKVDFNKGLVHSCDVYFYKQGERLGVDRIAPFAFASGFGRPTGIDLPHEKGGLVPTREWKRKRFGEPWVGGENLNLAIGQGFTLVTPLQVARFVGALQNGGVLMKPNLLRDALPVEQGRLPMSEATRKRILEAMVETVEEGTARRLKRKDAVIGGKTGTAQVVRLKLKAGDERRTLEEMPYEERDHAWLASWGEKDGERYVVVVMVEHGGHGGAAAGPVVKAIYEHLYGRP